MSVSDFRVKMQQSYDFKLAYAETRVHEFIKTCNSDVCVSVGGLDSITLLQFIRSIGYDIPAVSVTSIEDKSVREVQRSLNVIEVAPIMSKYHVLRDIGYPVFSKEIAHKIDVLQNPTEKNAGYRNAILTGQTTSKASREYSTVTKLADKYIKMRLHECPVMISDKCCLYMKEKPIAKWCKDNNCVPFLGLHADESRRRLFSLAKNGCNMYGKKARSAPFAIFTKSDILHLARDLNVPVPTAYGKIICNNNSYTTTGRPRTGCDICAFGIQFEKTRPHRFDILYLTEPNKWHFYIEQLDYGKLFDYIGFQYRQPYNTGDSAWK